ncbi:hypothetical protein BDF21DRAFT_493950 [Thamnidium elegans]|nr:hypothetical protein BDF21DRAFT_493950 [Thamnidium elegans]
MEVEKVILEKCVCPYYDEQDFYVDKTRVRQHIHRKHNIILLSRSKSQKAKNSKPYDRDNMNTFKNHVVKLSCPSCMILVEQKIQLRAHIVQHIGFLETSGGSNWIIGSENVSERFQRFRDYCIENSAKYVDVDCFFNHLLSVLMNSCSPKTQ